MKLRKFNKLKRLILADAILIACIVGVLDNPPATSLFWWIQLPVAAQSVLFMWDPEKALYSVNAGVAGSLLGGATANLALALLVVYQSPSHVDMGFTAAMMSAQSWPGVVFGGLALISCLRSLDKEPN